MQKVIIDNKYTFRYIFILSVSADVSQIPVILHINLTWTYVLALNIISINIPPCLKLKISIRIPHRVSFIDLRRVIKTMSDQFLYPTQRVFTAHYELHL